MRVVIEADFHHEIFTAIMLFVTMNEWMNGQCINEIKNNLIVN